MKKIISVVSIFLLALSLCSCRTNNSRYRNNYDDDSDNRHFFDKNNTTESNIVGDWCVVGKDDVYLKFTSDNTFFLYSNNTTGTYEITETKVLVINSDSEGTHRFEWDNTVTEETNRYGIWYVDGDTMYLLGKEFYKK